MLRRPFSSRLIFDCDRGGRPAPSSAVVPLSPRSLRSSCPIRRRLTVGLTLDATGRAPPAACLVLDFAYLLLSRLPPRCLLPLGNGVYALRTRRLGRRPDRARTCGRAGRRNPATPDVRTYGSVAPRGPAAPGPVFGD